MIHLVPALQEPLHQKTGPQAQQTQQELLHQCYSEIRWHQIVMFPSAHARRAIQKYAGTNSDVPIRYQRARRDSPRPACYSEIRLASNSDVPIRYTPHPTGAARQPTPGVLFRNTLASNSDVPIRYTPHPTGAARQPTPGVLFRNTLHQIVMCP